MILTIDPNFLGHPSGCPKMRIPKTLQTKHPQDRDPCQLCRKPVRFCRQIVPRVDFTNHRSQNGHIWMFIMENPIKMDDLVHISGQMITFHQPKVAGVPFPLLFWYLLGEIGRVFGHDEIWSENMRHIQTSKLNEPTQPSSSFCEDKDKLPKN